MKSYDDRTHTVGRIWMVLAISVVLAVPVSICVYYNAWPSLTAVFKGCWVWPPSSGRWALSKCSPMARCWAPAATWPLSPATSPT